MANDLFRTVHTAKRSRKASGKVRVKPDRSRRAIPSVSFADASEEDWTGITSRHTLTTNPVFLSPSIKPSINIPALTWDKIRQTAASTTGTVQQSPILGQRVRKRDRLEAEPDQTAEPVKRPVRESPPSSNAVGGSYEVFHEDSSLPALSKDFRRSEGDSSLETSTRRQVNPRDYAMTSGGFGLLETLETGRRNINLALDEIRDTETRRAVRSVLDREFGRISVAISQELTENAILARELSQRGSKGGEALSRGIPDGNKSQQPQPLVHNPERDPATEGSVALVFRPRNAPLDSKGEFTKRVNPVKEGLRIDSMWTTNKGDLVVTVPTESDFKSVRSNKSLTEVFRH